MKKNIVVGLVLVGLVTAIGVGMYMLPSSGGMLTGSVQNLSKLKTEKDLGKTDQYIRWGNKCMMFTPGDSRNRTALDTNQKFINSLKLSNCQENTMIRKVLVNFKASGLTADRINLFVNDENVESNLSQKTKKEVDLMLQKLSMNQQVDQTIEFEFTQPIKAVNEMNIMLMGDGMKSTNKLNDANSSNEFLNTEIVSVYNEVQSVNKDLMKQKSMTEYTLVESDVSSVEQPINLKRTVEML